MNRVQQYEAGWTVTARDFLLAARVAGVAVIPTAEPVFLSPEGAGVSRGTVIGRTGVGGTGAVAIGAHRGIALAAFGACRRGLPPQRRLRQ